MRAISRFVLFFPQAAECAEELGRGTAIQRDCFSLGSKTEAFKLAQYQTGKNVSNIRGSFPVSLNLAAKGGLLSPCSERIPSPTGPTPHL